jgi:regulator of protease activity HflC (stomatin/prohibitin superfamily)
MNINHPVYPTPRPGAVGAATPHRRLENTPQPQQPVQFGASFSDRLNSRYGKDAWTPGRIIKYVGVAALSLFGVHAGCNSYDVNPIGTRSVVVNNAFSGPSKEVKGQGMVILFPPYLTHNIQVKISNQTVKEYFEPLSRDGVRINGSGQQANVGKEGVQVSVSYQIDPGEDGNYDSVYKIITEVLGGVPNEKAIPNSPSTHFETDEPFTKALYFQVILPRLKGDLYSLSTLYNAEDFHNSRDFLTDALNKGYKTTVKESDGTIREIDIKPLAEQLKPFGIKVNMVSVTDIDPPEFMKAEIKKRGELPLAISNFKLEERTNQALADAAREKAKSEAAVLLQQAIGQNNATLATAKGAVEIETQKAAEAVAKAKGDADALLETAKGKAAAQIAEKKGIADSDIAQAKGISTAAVIQAKGEAEATVKQGKAKADVLVAEGSQLKQFPELLERLAIEKNQEARLALAKQLDLVLVDPSTPVDDTILRIGDHKYRMTPNVRPTQPTTQPPAAEGSK